MNMKLKSCIVIITFFIISSGLIFADVRDDDVERVYVEKPINNYIN